MRISVQIDDELLDKARRITKIENVSTLLNVCFGYLVQHGAADALIELGGSSPEINSILRRHQD